MTSSRTIFPMTPIFLRFRPFGDGQDGRAPVDTHPTDDREEGPLSIRRLLPLPGVSLSNLGHVRRGRGGAHRCPEAFSSYDPRIVGQTLCGVSRRPTITVASLTPFQNSYLSSRGPNTRARSTHSTGPIRGTWEGGFELKCLEVRCAGEIRTSVDTSRVSGPWLIYLYVVGHQSNDKSG